MALGMEVGLGPSHIVLDGDPVPSSKMVQSAPHPKKIGPFLSSPNGWMHQDATWYGGRPRPRRLCVQWGPSYPRTQGTPTTSQFLAHVYCGQTAGWVKTPLGTEVDLRAGHIVLGLDALFPALRGRGTAPPSFMPISIVATVAHLSYC